MKHLKLFEETEINESKRVGAFSSKFIVVLHQSGGCDYTIECGTKIIDLESTDIDSTHSEISEIIEDYTGELSLESVKLYEIKGEHDIDIDAIYDTIENKVNSRKEADIDRKEREEYGRLSKKYK